MSPSERAAIDHLDAYLEAIALGHPVSSDGDGVDADLRDLDSQLRWRSQLPDPPPTFAAQLWFDLMQTLPGPSPIAADLQPPRQGGSTSDRLMDAPQPPAGHRRWNSGSARNAERQSKV